MLLLSALIAGLIFGSGLILSGMANPAKVQGFLDIGGLWDPSLAFVMVGAIAVSALAFALIRDRSRSLIGAELMLPSSRQIDRRLVCGAIVFGVGWGLAGFCPGPGLVALGMGSPEAAIFVAAMLAGMGIFELIEAARRRPAAPSAK